MNEELSGVNLRERETSARPLGEAAGNKRKTPPSRAGRRPGRAGLAVLPLAISILALIVAGTALLLVLRGGGEPEIPPEAEEEPVTFRFGDMVLTPDRKSVV